MCCVISITRFCLEIFSQCNYTDLQGWLKRSTCATRAVPYTGTVNDAVKSQGRICTVVSGNHEFFFPTLLLLVFMFVSLSVGLAAMPLLLHVKAPPDWHFFMSLCRYAPCVRQNPRNVLGWIRPKYVRMAQWHKKAFSQRLEIRHKNFGVSCVDISWHKGEPIRRG